MANWSGTDPRAGAPRYEGSSTEPNYFRGVGQSSIPIPDSPHESDDEEITLLKNELRILRYRNERALYHSTHGTYNGNNASSQSNVAPVVQFTSQGPVYQHPVVTNAVPNTSNNGTYATQSDDSIGKDVGACWKCLLLIITFFVVIAVVISITHGSD